MASNGSVVAGHEFIQDFTNESGLTNPGGQNDTLPRVRVRPVGRAVQSRINGDTGKPLDESLLDVYDPDAIGRTFFHPVEEIAPLITHVPINSKREGWYDPPRPHRIQVLKGWKRQRGQSPVPVLKEYNIKTARELKELSESDQYRKSRYYESTGSWEQPEGAQYKRFVESFNPSYQDKKPAQEHALEPRTLAMLKEADERFLREAHGAGTVGRLTLPSGRIAMRESAIDPFSYDTVTNATSVTANIDQEFVPITGGCLTGDTEIPFLDGTVHRLEDLAREYGDKSFWVYSVDSGGHIVPGRGHHPRQTGAGKEILEVELDNGERVRCTPDHPWLLRDGTYLAAYRLTPGMSIMPLYTRLSTKGLCGYELLYQPDIDRYVYTHKSFIGKVSRGSVVHHHDFNKRNNDPSNLVVMLGTDHLRLHQRINSQLERSPETRARTAASLTAYRATHPEYIEFAQKGLDAGRALMKTDSERERRRKMMRDQWSDQQWAQSQREKITAAINTDDGRAKQGELSRRRWAKEKAGIIPDSTAGNRQAWADPTKRAERVAKMRMYFTPEIRAHRADQLRRLRTERGVEWDKDRRRVATNHKVVAVRPAGFADVYDFTVDEYHNFALSAGAFVHNSYYRQLYLYAHWEQTAKAFEQKNHSELARTAINVTTDFCLGRGVAWKIKNEKVEEIWREFWTRCKMDQRMRVLSDDRTWQGELIIHEHEILKGFLQIRSIDPGAFWEIVTSPDDIETPLYYYASFPQPYQIPYAKAGTPHLNIPSSKYIIEQYPANEIYHLKGNVSSSEKWGRSDFFASLGTLKRHRDWVNAVTLRDMLQANLVWVITINGDDADVQTFLNDQNNAQVPAYGGTWVQNSALTLEPAHQDVTTRQMGQGSVGQFLTALFATGQQMSSAYFNLQGEGAARATALVQGEPFAKKIDNRQQVFSELLDHLFTEVMEKAVRAGRLDAKLLRSADADPEWIWPIIFEEDRNAKLAALTTAKGMAVLSHRTYATTIASEFSLKEYNYEREMADIRKEAQDPVLKLWPPLTGGAMAVTAPPVPTAPVPAVGASPATTPGAPATGTPEGTHERLAGADERANFKAQQGEHVQQETARLSESDRAYLEEQIATGATGAVKLPSGLTAIIHENTLPPPKTEGVGDDGT